MNNISISVVIADDHDIFRDGLSLLFEGQERFKLLDSCRDGEQLLRSVQVHRPDIVLTDLKMPFTSGVQAIEKIVQDFPETLCIALSNIDSEYMIIEAMNAGAVGYLNKGSEKSEIFKAFELVLRGEEYYCRSTSVKLMHLFVRNMHPRKSAKHKFFSQNERDIIKLICEDKSVAQIAESLNLGKRTVENARGRIFDKMNVTTVAGIAIYAVRHELYFVSRNE